ncbi:hypothetical protein C8J56DRAFT_886849 [Mycena floridula]|nr:hypothetical protein C8J56DRAFT_886849 [Mycena floridula]
MSKKKSAAPNQFHVDSSRHCDVCDKDVKIGTGSEGNWTQHLASNNHIKNSTRPRARFIKAPEPKPVKEDHKISSFFSKITTPSIGASSSSSHLQPSLLPSQLQIEPKSRSISSERCEKPAVILSNTPVVGSEIWCNCLCTQSSK